MRNMNMIKTARLYVIVWPKNAINSKETHQVEFYDLTCADLKNFYERYTYERYTLAELSILLYDQLKEPLQHLCIKLRPYIEGEEL